MIRLVILLLAVTLGPASAAGRMTFWNLTSNTVTFLSLAPAGSEAWGPNQCANDKDGAVDADERLPLTGVDAGRYDVRLGDRTRSCVVRNVELSAGKPYAFSLSDADLKDCQPNAAPPK
ncbi:MAG: hypothetical protein JOZ42_08690 [Acetobacteraceae bacterium]|nr:hypothetical protein [Acetobacteraceae bacterium]